MCFASTCKSRNRVANSATWPNVYLDDLSIGCLSSPIQLYVTLGQTRQRNLTKSPCSSIPIRRNHCPLTRDTRILSFLINLGRIVAFVVATEACSSRTNSGNRWKPFVQRGIGYVNRRDDDCRAEKIHGYRYFLADEKSS